MNSSVNNSVCINYGFPRIGDCINALSIILDKTETEKNYLEAPMPWIGMYIALASAACTLAIAADAFNGIRRKKFWIPCKLSSLNAFSLTVLAVAMKLLVDLTSNTRGLKDKLAKITSLVLMSNAMGNFMTSLGSMENNEIILNMAGLSILVITIAVNVYVHVTQMLKIDLACTFRDTAVSTILMLLLLITLCSLSMMVPSAKRNIESKYNEVHKRVPNKPVDWGKFGIDELRNLVKMYWVMAATGSPEFVIARSVMSGTSGLICLLMALTLVEAHVRLPRVNHTTGLLDSYLDLYERIRPITTGYKWSINWILWIQTTGVVFGTIANLFRWFHAAWFKTSEIGQKCLRDEFKIEDYWTSWLVEWRESPLPLQIRHQMCRKILRDAKRLVLNICIGVQILFVLTSKLVLFISASVGSAIFFRFHDRQSLRRPDPRTPNDIPEGDLRNYVLQLEGEAQLPEKILKNICNELDQLIQIGERKQSTNLITLLNKSENFNGVREFDTNVVPSLKEPPNCWSLPVVTLTSIAIALPNITTAKVNQLLKGVSEGLSLVKLIEKTLDRNGQVESIRDAADMVWVGVELDKKWQDRDLRSTNLKGRTHKETLETLSNIAKKVIEDFTTKTKNVVMQNPLSWPVEVIAANSMYRITQTILQSHKYDEIQTEEELFERLSIIISDILAACLTNLAHAITLKCHSNAIKERQESVRQAAILLGQSKEILENLQQRDFPSLDPEKAANIEEWRAVVEQDSVNPPAFVSASSNNKTTPQPNGEQLSIEIEGSLQEDRVREGG